MITLLIPAELLAVLSDHLEAAYPDEGAGFFLGKSEGELRSVGEVFPLPNAREAEARHNRFLITPQDYARAEQRAAQSGLDVLGVFHSHPDSPNIPSEFDRQWALPYFAYWITTVSQGKCTHHRVWMLRDDRTEFVEIAYRVPTTNPSVSELYPTADQHQSGVD